MENINSIIWAVITDFTSFFSLKTKSGRIKLVILIVVFLTTAFFLAKDKHVDETQVETARLVEVGSVLSLNSTGSFTLVGTVEAKNQAIIQAETSGRVTKVNVELGQTIPANYILAELENSAQYASLLQAEGSYEAALASAAQSGVSVATASNNFQSAKESALTTYSTSFSTINNTVLSTIDQFFSNPQNKIFGVRIDVGSQALDLTAQRSRLNTVLSDWQNSSLNATTDSDIDFLLLQAISDTKKVLALTDAFLSLVTQAPLNDTLDDEPVRDYADDLNAARSTLLSVISNLQAAQTNLLNSEETLKQVTIGGSQSNESSLANAQVKQALGVLRAAQANYQKTVLRTSVAGTVNEINYRVGEYVNQGSRVAVVANNSGLEVTTYVGANDIEKISVGQSVEIEKKFTGTVVAIAPAVDTDTRKTEVKIAFESEDIRTGDVVNLNFSVEKTDSELYELFVPITAIKFTATDGSMFRVANGKLVSFSVSVGSISGSYVEITDGLSPEEEFVLDVRGLSDGLSVETY